MVALFRSGVLLAVVVLCNGCLAQLHLNGSSPLLLEAPPGASGGRSAGLAPVLWALGGAGFTAGVIRFRSRRAKNDPPLQFDREDQALARTARDALDFLLRRKKEHKGLKPVERPPGPRL